MDQAAPAPPNLTLNPAPKGQGINPPYQAPVTGGLSVNTDSREEVRGFYDAIYPASDNIAQNSTADASSCFPGHNADAFQLAELLRINWFRAMAGDPASITLDPNDDWGSQQMAIIISANNALNHNPPSTYDCYNTNAAAYAGGDQALGADGPDATTLFIWDFGAKNNEVGHRRWILYPPETIMGVGDVPGSGPNAAGNLTYVFDPASFGSRPATRQPYVSWPPEGYVPYQVVYPYWSFGLSNADLSAAIVIMTSNGVPVSTVIQPYQTGFGENTLVWVPMGLDATTEGTSFPFGGTDTVYNVTITNINYNGAIIGYSYNVRVFDPAVPGSDYIPSTVKGPAQAAVGVANSYYVTPPINPHVTSYNFMTAQLGTGNLFDNAGNGLTNFNLTPEPNYSVINTGPNGLGTCFNLEHADTNSAPQLFTLDEILLPQTNTSISFESELGYASTNEVARVQISADGGANWIDLYARPGSASGSSDSAFTNIALSLSNYAGDTVLLRFNFDFQGGSYFDGGYPIGWFFTDVLITNTQALFNQTTNNSTVTNIVSGNLEDSANNGLVNFTLTPPPYYYVTTNPPVGSEPNCFHLTHIDPTSQYLQLNELLLPNAGSTVTFSSELAYASSDEYALVEVSTNNGTTWNDLYSEAGDNAFDESSFTPHILSLASCAGQPTLLRFNYSFTGGSFFTGSANYIGWNIEDILVTNCQQILVTTIDTTNFTFTPTQAGTYILQDQPVIYGQFPLSVGPVTKVTVTTPHGIAMNPPAITNRLVSLNFTVAGLTNTTFKLLQAAQLSGPWTTNKTAPFITNTPGSSYRFTVTNNSSAQSYRIQSP
ncbi:MAG TPA: hypothetical protein VMH87_06375 [Pseudomonadales bacterium]|nr:hypothetical protein [Pseudomonadales bacterium]